MSRDGRIDAYIARSAPFARPILKHLRKLIHRAEPSVEETIKWGFPSYVYHDKILCGTAAFKAHISFGFWHRGMEDLLNKELGKTNEAMGLMGRVTSLADLPDDPTLLRYVKLAVRLHDSGLRARPKPKPKPALPVPADLAGALKKNPRAAAVWKNFSPSARREYIEWITEAKRVETRTRRLATTVEWVAAGKPRNWKYMNC